MFASFLMALLTLGSIPAPIQIKSADFRQIFIGLAGLMRIMLNTHYFQKARQPSNTRLCITRLVFNGYSGCILTFYSLACDKWQRCHGWTSTDSWPTSAACSLPCTSPCRWVGTRGLQWPDYEGGHCGWQWSPGGIDKFQLQTDCASSATQGW